MAPANAFIPGESVPAPYPSSTTPKMTSEPPSGYDPGALHILLHLCLYSEQVSLHVNLSKTESQFTTALQLFKCKPHWSSMANVMGLIFLVQVPRGSPGGTWTPHSIRGTSTVVISLPLVGHALWVWVLSRLHLWPSCPPWHGILFTFQAAENLLC